MGSDPLRIVRLCSVFEAPPASLAGRGIRFDPIGGMQNHTASLTRALDALGVVQEVVTTRPPGAPAHHRIGQQSTVHHLGLPVPAMRQLYSLPAAALVGRLAGGARLLHAHLGEDLAIVPIAMAAARRHRIPWVLTIHASLTHTLVAGGARGALLRRLGGRLERIGSGGVGVGPGGGHARRPADRRDRDRRYPRRRRRRQLGAADRARSPHYRWDALAERVLAVYPSALSAPRRDHR